jgi:hypothetical protein
MARRLQAADARLAAAVDHQEEFTQGIGGEPEPDAH